MQERISIEETIREAGLKKKYVANELGVSDTYINEYLKKPGSISVKNASIICKLINVNYIQCATNRLFTGKGCKIYNLL